MHISKAKSTKKKNNKNLKHIFTYKKLLIIMIIVYNTHLNIEYCEDMNKQN